MKRNEREMLDLIARKLARLEVKQRHEILIALTALHIGSFPGNLTLDAATNLHARALELVDKAKEERKGNAPSDIRH